MGAEDRSGIAVIRLSEAAAVVATLPSTLQVSVTDTDVMYRRALPAGCAGYIADPVPG